LLVSETSRKAKTVSTILLTILFHLLLFSGSLFGSGVPDEETVNYKGRILSIRWNSLTRAPLIMRGVKSNLLEIKHFSKLSREEITGTGLLVVDQYKPFLGIDPHQIRLKAAEKISDTWYVSYWQTFHDIIIYESSLGFSIDPQGHVKSLGALLYPHVRAPITSKVSREKALKIGQQQIKDYDKLKCILLAENVLIYPVRQKNSIVYYRVYAFNFFPEKALHPASVVGGWAVFIDTQTGKTVLYETLLKPLGCCVPEDWVPPDPKSIKPKW
jgi:hypothetical protein